MENNVNKVQVKVEVDKSETEKLIKDLEQTKQLVLEIKKTLKDIRNILYYTKQLGLSPRQIRKAFKYNLKHHLTLNTANILKQEYEDLKLKGSTKNFVTGNEKEDKLNG